MDILIIFFFIFIIFLTETPWYSHVHVVSHMERGPGDLVIYKDICKKSICAEINQFCKIKR